MSTAIPLQTGPQHDRVVERPIASLLVAENAFECAHRPNKSQRLRRVSLGTTGSGPIQLCRRASAVLCDSLQCWPSLCSAFWCSCGPLAPLLPTGYGRPFSGFGLYPRRSASCVFALAACAPPSPRRPFSFPIASPPSRGLVAGVALAMPHPRLRSAWRRASATRMPRSRESAPLPPGAEPDGRRSVCGLVRPSEKILSKRGYRKLGHRAAGGNSLCMRKKPRHSPTKSPFRFPLRGAAHAAWVGQKSGCGRLAVRCGLTLQSHSRVGKGHLPPLRRHKTNTNIRGGRGISTGPPIEDNSWLLLPVPSALPNSCH